MMFCKELNWRGLYSQSYDLWCDDAVAHPAKMAPGLCFKIIEHLEELGLIEGKATILDFMGGIGTSAICSCLKGYRAITLELENKFVKLQEDNKRYVEAKTYRKLDWEILQGDARELSKLLTERGLIGLCSPPYGDAEKRDRSREDSWQKEVEHPRGDKAISKGYSSNPDNIGNLKDTGR